MKENDLMSDFSSLLDRTQDLDVLEEFQKALKERIDVVSNSGSTKGSNDGNNLSEKDLHDGQGNNFVPFLPADKFPVTVGTDCISKDFGVKLLDELTRLFSRVKGDSKMIKYQWLNSNNDPYSFGCKRYNAKMISGFPFVYELLGKLNKELDCNLNSCLIACYQSSDISGPLHSDDEDIMDQDHVVCNVSLGPKASLEFYEFDKSESDEPVATYQMENNSILMMLPGCQQQYKHKVILASDTETQYPRFCLSFRKAIRLPDVKGTQVIYNLVPIDEHQSISTTQQGYFGFHPLREQVCVDKNISAHPKIKYQHLIIGDSLTRDISTPDCYTITKGGCGIKDIINMLNKDSGINEAEYRDFKSVTLCVGTNPVSNTQYPLLHIMHDYNDLVRKLSNIFPNAVIGLFNITPRKYNNFQHLIRIKSFNNFLYDLEFTYRFAKVINVFWEFIDAHGFIIPKFYDQTDFLHLSSLGKELMR